MQNNTSYGRPAVQKGAARTAHRLFNRGLGGALKAEYNGRHRQWVRRELRLGMDNEDLVLDPPRRGQRLTSYDTD